MGTVGVDGWRGRWVAAHLAGREVSWTVHDTFAQVLDAFPGRTVAVDMPIGLTDGLRVVDEAARAWLRERGGRWQSIFLTPDRWTYEQWRAGRTHAQAMAARPAGAPGTSIQAWNLLPLIDQVGGVATGRVVEAHPECSFRLLDARIGRASKKTAQGAGLRLRALAGVLDVDLAHAPPDVPVDDVLDATVLAWTAARYDRGEHLTLPPGATAAPRIVI